MMKPNKIPGIVIREPGQRITIYSPQTDIITEISPHVKEIIELCDGTRTVEQIVKAIATRHNEQASVLKETMGEVLEELKKRHLITLETKEGDNER